MHPTRIGGLPLYLTARQPDGAVSARVVSDMTTKRICRTMVNAKGVYAVIDIHGVTLIARTIVRGRIDEAIATSDYDSMIAWLSERDITEPE